jgi:hypothetical protein
VRPLARSLAPATLLLPATTPSAAQVRACVSVHAELLGIGGLYSVDDDRRLGSGGVAARVGAASWETEGGLSVLVCRLGLTRVYCFDDEDTAYPETGFFPSGGLSLGVSL